jgi:excisionase family DNA binding protein
MGERLDHAIAALRDALQKHSGPVEVTLALERSTAERVLRLLNAEHGSGAVVVPVRVSYSTTEASAMLGISRATLMKLVDAGELEAFKVGTHHRIHTESLVAYQRLRQVSQSRASELLVEFSARSAERFQSNVTFRTDGDREV